MIAGALYRHSAPADSLRRHVEPKRSRLVAASEDGRAFMLADGMHAALLTTRAGWAALATHRAANVPRPHLEQWFTSAEPWNAALPPAAEWSAAILDRDGRSVLLVSDLIGSYPLYWSQTADATYWSTSPEWVLERLPRRSISDAYLSGLLTVGTPAHVTPWNELHAVRPAHTCRLTSGGPVSETPYWSADAIVVRDVSLEEAIASLREALTRAVQKRVSMSNRVWFELSGGLDSSTLTCIGAAGRRGGPRQRDIRLLTYVDDDFGKDSEAPFVQAVSDACGVPHLQLRASRLPLIAAQQSLLPDLRSGAHQVIEQLIIGQGDGLIVSGRFGDSAMFNRLNCPDSLFSTLRHRGLAACCSAILDSACSARSTVWEECGGLLRLALPPAIRGYMARRLLRARLDRTGKEACITDVCHERALEVASTLVNPAHAAGGPIEHRLLLAEISLAITQRTYSNRDWRRTAHVTYPFTDRELLETMLAIPAHLAVAPGTPRRLMRLAIEGIVPERIRRRTGKSYAASSVSKRLRPYASAMLDQQTLLIAERGLIDPAALRSALRRLTLGAGTAVGSLREIIVIENWLRHVEGVEQIVALRDQSPAA